MESFGHPYIKVRYKPDVWNGKVYFRRYNVEVTEVKETVEVLCARLEKLYVESNNSHHLNALNAEAKKLGYTFKGRWGECDDEDHGQAGQHETEEG